VTETRDTTFALALFSPDATTTGLYRKGIHCIEASGLYILDGVWARLSHVQANELYARNRLKGYTAFDELVDTLFSLDWSLALRVSSLEPIDGATLHQRLKTLKGPSDPAKQSAGQIRKELGAESRLMNFVHTSDSTADSRREVSLVLSGDFVRATDQCGNIVEPRDLSYRSSVCLADSQRRLLDALGPDGLTATSPTALLSSLYSAQEARDAIEWLTSVGIKVDVWDKLILYSNSAEAR
jgi:nucleoside diphosphate kinase